MSRNEDNVMHVYLASITSLSSGPLVKCKQRSIHFTNCCVSLGQHCDLLCSVTYTGNRYNIERKYCS